MPNHVKTMVKVKKLKSREEIDMVLDMIARPLIPSAILFKPDMPDHNWIIDFSKIIPEPETEEECPKEYIRTEDDHISTVPDKPWFNWYKWNCTYWGTKWGAYDGYTIIGANYIKFVFSTAWSVASPVIQKLSLLGYDIDVKYADEDLGSNCGTMSYRVEDGAWDWETELDEPYKFAQRVWREY